jgi:hypothetical protein
MIVSFIEMHRIYYKFQVLLSATVCQPLHWGHGITANPTLSLHFLVNADLFSWEVSLGKIILFVSLLDKVLSVLHMYINPNNQQNLQNYPLQPFHMTKILKVSGA